MQNYLVIILAVCITTLHSRAQLTVVADGIDIVVENTTDVKIEQGGLINTNNAQINNDGNIYIDQDFTQNLGADYLGTANSWLWFEGATDQNIISDNLVQIAGLRVDNNNRLILQNNVQVDTRLDLMNNGNILLNTHIFTVPASTTISNYDANNYIITNSTGTLDRDVSSTDIIFPVGNSSFNPATLNNTGTSDNFSVRVFEQVFNEGTTGPLETANVVGRTWMIDEAVTGGSNVNMLLQWQTAEELTSFDRNNCGITRHLSGTLWDNPPAYTPATNVGTNIWTQSRANFTSFSPFVVRDPIAMLPVELLEFQAKRQDPKTVRLEWSTATEINNAGFEIERMLDNEESFQYIDFVEGYGNSTSLINYAYVDDNSHSGVSYYRLRQVDFDGTTSYSEVRAVYGENNPFDAIIVYPNPVREALNVQFGQLNSSNKFANLRVFNALGQNIYEATIAVASHEIFIIEDLEDWAAGTYLLEIVMDTGEGKVVPFVKE